MPFVCAQHAYVLRLQRLKHSLSQWGERLLQRLNRRSSPLIFLIVTGKSAQNVVQHVMMHDGCAERTTMSGKNCAVRRTEPTCAADFCSPLHHRDAFIEKSVDVLLYVAFDQTADWAIRLSKGFRQVMGDARW